MNHTFFPGSLGSSSRLLLVYCCTSASMLVADAPLVLLGSTSLLVCSPARLLACLPARLLVRSSALTLAAHSSAQGCVTTIYIF